MFFLIFRGWSLDVHPASAYPYSRDFYAFHSRIPECSWRLRPITRGWDPERQWLERWKMTAPCVTRELRKKNTDLSLSDLLEENEHPLVNLDKVQIIRNKSTCHLTQQVAHLYFHFLSSPRVQIVERGFEQINWSRMQSRIIICHQLSPPLCDLSLRFSFCFLSMRN